MAKHSARSGNWGEARVSYKKKKKKHLRNIISDTHLNCITTTYSHNVGISTVRFSQQCDRQTFV